MIHGNLSNKLHILIVPSWYKTPETPVLGTFFEEQARSLQKQGHFVGIIYPEYLPPSEKFKYPEHGNYDFYVDKGIPTFNIKSNVGIPKLRKLSYYRFSKMVDRVFEDYIDYFGRPDIIHAHSAFHAGICGLYISQKHRIPFVITEHLTSYLLGNINNITDIRLSKQVFVEASAAIIVSNNFKKDLEHSLNLPVNTFKVVHNLVNDLFLDSFTPRTYVPGGEFYFFTNSFLVSRKNIALLIDAMKILSDKYPLIRLKICGEGPDEDELRNQIKRLGIDDRISFTGKLFRHEVKQAIDDSHCFVLASQYETFGVVLIESLACGRPVVTTNSGGPLDFINPDQGVIVHKHDAQALANGMEYVMQHYNEYDQKKLVDYCRNKFSEEVISGQLITIYKDVLKKYSGIHRFDDSSSKVIQKRKLLITFDYELFLGKRSGLVDDCVLEPTYKLMQILDKYKIHAIFFVDTMYLIRLKEQAQTVQQCDIDFKRVAKQLTELVSKGHYIFPHVHPHWMDAQYLPGQNQWNLSNINKYRFHNISEKEREFAFEQSVNILNEILHPHFPLYKVDSFRAGGWCIQPFSDFLPYFKKYNILYEFSVMKGFYHFTNAHHFDFTSTPRSNIYHFKDNVCEENLGGPFTQYSISSMDMPLWILFLNKMWLKFKFRVVNDHTMYKGEGQAAHSIPGLNPVSFLGSNLENTKRERIAVELLTAIKLRRYNNFVKNSDYMHFVSHPKMIANHNIKVFDIFLKNLYNNYKVETDFRRMNPD